MLFAQFVNSPTLTFLTELLSPVSLDFPARSGHSDATNRPPADRLRTVEPPVNRLNSPRTVVFNRQPINIQLSPPLQPSPPTSQRRISDSCSPSPRPHGIFPPSFFPTSSRLTPSTLFSSTANARLALEKEVFVPFFDPLRPFYPFFLFSLHLFWVCNAPVVFSQFLPIVGPSIFKGLGYGSRQES